MLNGRHFSSSFELIKCPTEGIKWYSNNQKCSRIIYDLGRPSIWRQAPTQKLDQSPAVDLGRDKHLDKQLVDCEYQAVKPCTVGNQF